MTPYVFQCCCNQLIHQSTDLSTVLKVSKLQWTPGGVLDFLVNFKRKIQEDRTELTSVNQARVNVKLDLK